MGIVNASDKSNHKKLDYRIADQDTGSDPEYYSFMSSTDYWYILKIGVSAGTYRYVSGTTDYSDAWTNRASHTYVHWGVAF